jgi:hypothetical protein
MDVEALASWIIRRGVLTPQAIARARRRHQLYGGGFDTILLELGLLDEAALGTCLADASGLDQPRPEWLETPSSEARALMDLATARRLGAIPVSMDEERVQLVVRPGTDLVAATEWAADRDRGARCFVVLEVRFEALLAASYGTVVPPRFATLLGRLMGSERARRWASTHAAPTPEITAPPVETGPRAARRKPVTETELEIIEDVGALAEGYPTPEEATAGPPAPPEAKSAEELLARLGAGDEAVQLAALQELRRRLADPQVQRLAAGYRREALGQGPGATQAMAALAELRDRHAVPVLLQQLKSDDRALATAAHAALVTITRHDFGFVRWRWGNWWREWRHRHRAEWLIDALVARTPELRLAAGQELEELGGRYVGYHYDLGKREREEARRRWSDWWESTGRATLAASDPIEPPER